VVVVSQCLDDVTVFEDCRRAVGLLMVGITIALPLVRDISKVSSLMFGLALAVGLVELLLDAIPGIALRLDGHVLPGVAALAAHRDWGPSPLGDQRTAGAILWSVAEILDLPFLLVLTSQWFRADARETIAVDAQLDAAAWERELRRPVTAEEALSVRPEPLREQPWWEIDSHVFDEARRQQFTTKTRTQNPNTDRPRNRRALGPPAP
jgi:putative copper resistance protein D